MLSESSAKKIAIISVVAFCCFIIGYFTLSFFSRCGFINIEIESIKTQTLIAFLGLSPLLIALYFIGQVAKHKAGYFQNTYKILTFVSIALLAFGILQMILAFFGAYG